MGESNGAWGTIDPKDDSLQAEWDEYYQLPPAGENAILDAFVESKWLTIEDLIRVGTRIKGDGVTLVHLYPRAIKWRNIITGQRGTSLGGDLMSEMKIVRPSIEASNIIIVEGETDAAMVSRLYPECHVAVLSGAEHFQPNFVSQLKDYDGIFIGLDNDDAGERGAAKIQELVPHAVRVHPEGDDWCSEEPARVELPEPGKPEPVFYTTHELLTMETPDIPSFYEHAVLPVGGLVVIHGWAKSFKSFIAFDLAASLAQCEPWATFEPMAEPVKVGIIQYEIPRPYYQARWNVITKNAVSPDLLNNVMHYRPQARPGITAGNKEAELELVEACLKAGINVVIIDPVRRASGTLDLNSEHEVRVMLNLFARMQDAGLTVIFTHHDNKEGARAGGGSPISMTGSGAFAGDADTIVSVSLPKGEHLDTSTKRNMHFTLRNAPILSPRGVEITEEGLAYQDIPHAPETSAGDDTQDVQL